MRIRAIRGRGLASLAEPFELDLDAEPMRGCGVFVIGGPTGAGKSTILDAMCLALFDRAPRVARAPQREVLRAGTRASRGAAPSGDAANVEVGLAGRTRDDAPSDVIRASDPRSLVRRGTRHAFAEVEFEGRRGGLFRARWEVRSVQRRGGGWALGKPAMSLESVSLESLESVRVGTTKTDVLAQIEARLGLDFGQFCRSVLLPQGELASFLEAPDDERARLLERVTGTEIYSTLSRVVHTRAAGLVREARERSVEIEAVRLLSDVEREELVAQRDEARVEAARTTKRVAELVAIERAHDTARVLGEQLTQASRELDDVTRQLGLWEPRRDEIDRSRRAREVRAERQAARSASADLSRVEAELARVVAQIESTEPQREVTLTALETERAGLRSLEEQTVALEEALGRHETALASASERSGKDEALRHARRSAETALDDALKRERDAKKSADAFERELASVEREAVADAGTTPIGPLAALVRRELHEGDPCPVCGSIDHPAHAGPSASSSQRDGQRDGKREARAALDAIEERQRRAARLASLHVDASRAQATAAVRREDSERARAQLDSARAAAELSSEERAALRRAVESEHGVELPAQRRAAHLRTLGAARARVGTLERESIERAALSSHLRGQRDALSVRVEGLAIDARRADAVLQGALAAHGLSATELALAERVDDRELAGLLAELGRLDRRRDEQRAIVLERRRRFDEAEASLPAGLPARDEIEASRRDADRAKTQAEQVEAIAESRLSDDTARRTEREQRRAALGALESDARTWETLSRLVGSADGKKLRVLVQSMALDILLAHANAQLRGLAPRYQLTRRASAAGVSSPSVAWAPAGPGSLALDVLDADLEGGPRSTSSLSGGERFLVSLALALGLGTMTAERDDVGSLFLDEGFGSLDEDSLEQALEALDALRQAGRQIGVVSHVARLAERFEVRVEVRPSEPGASTVHVTTS